MKRYMTVGLSVLAGVALFEVALIPGVVIGAAAVLAPKYLPKLRRSLQPLFDATFAQKIEPAAPLPDSRDIKAPPSALTGFAIKQAIAKTITFRIIATTADFTANYVVIGDLATAAGLSTIGVVVAPFFYLVHETAWNHFSPGEPMAGRAAVLIFPPGTKLGQGGFAINRALAKTITFRSFATVMDFTANYVVTGDLAAAVVLTAFGFVVGPIIYFGHEMAWDHYGAPRADILALPAPAKLASA
ncbi:MAG: DUF2061 domain-containing protein [Beijerinckiaceae bacterium]